MRALLVIFLAVGVIQAQVVSSRARTVTKAQQVEDEGDVLRLDTELVSVPFSVVDKRNRYITDLKQEDIAVYEDGKQQEIFSFTKETDLPLTFAILLDISGSQELTLPAQKEAAYRFLEKVLKPDRDLAAIITFRKDVEMVQGLTSNLKQLKQVLDSVTFNAGVGSIASTPPWGGVSYAGTSLYDAIYVTTDELLEKEAGRRVIIVLTDGRDTTSSYSRQKAIERAWRAEVIIYAIGIRGMGRYGGQIFTEDIDQKTLQKITEETGGRLFIPKDESDYDVAFAQIEEDLRQQYIVSYAPTNDAKDGSFRSIAVKIINKNAKDLRVLHRKGYFAKKE
ncbi:MAG: VWA domain-containing protein [Acidobacteriota bacterium]|nr:VWA domain-containing protein [Blastocatellia bacterium]MDW8413431.1 VWA domain-containing protein [Acidobacteriota bacterium]